MKLVHIRTITLSCMVHVMHDLKIIWYKWSSWQNNMSWTRTMSLGQDLCYRLHLNFVHRFQWNVFVSTHNLSIFLGFIYNVAQMIIMIRGCVANKNHVSSLEFKVIDHTQTLFVGYNKKHVISSSQLCLAWWDFKSTWQDAKSCS